MKIKNTETNQIVELIYNVKSQDILDDIIGNSGFDVTGNRDGDGNLLMSSVEIKWWSNYVDNAKLINDALINASEKQKKEIAEQIQDEPDIEREQIIIMDILKIN